ncbi:MAG TPA: protease pro-enzyme activation domain-containing protein [Candidatus Binatia bacterium]|nr:protease pro-enzyme activation domain-containing protein [Candidatus Binatia bacterium]
MTARPRLRFLEVFVAIVAALAVPAYVALAQAGTTRYTPPQGLLAGMTPTDKVDATALLRIVIELEPKDAGLEALAAAAVDPASPQHRAPLSQAQFIARFGRSQADVDQLATLLRNSGARDAYVAADRLVVGGTMTTVQAEAAFKTKFAIFSQGNRTAIAPTSPLTIPVAGIRAVRGSVAATNAHLADVPVAQFTTFRGAWYTPARFREAYDALPDGGANSTIALIEDASDRFNLDDLKQFLSGDGAPPGASAARVTERVFVDKPAQSECGRDDRGQEPTIDVDAAVTMAPSANVQLRYEDICARGDEGTVALERVLDEPQPPNIIVLPIVAGPVYGPTSESYGPTSIPYLEAAVRGIPVVVPAGDDGAYGYHIAGIEKPGIAYPCVLPYVICAGGTQLGERTGEALPRGQRPAPAPSPSGSPQGRRGGSQSSIADRLAGPLDEAPWNDGGNATGGGISADPRPSWQVAPAAFEFSAQFVKSRMVPDVSADAAGHLRAYWHNYGFGGVAGTSESAALVAAQIVAINAAVAPEKRIASAGDLYALARVHPDAFRDISRENDRGYVDNTIRPQRLPLPLNYRGALPSPPPTVKGCAGVQPDGCTVKIGYDAVTGIGSLKERAAARAL